MDIKEIITPDIVEYYKNNQSEITQELIDSLRQYGNKGKQIVLDMLDMPQDIEGFYLDAFGNKVSYKGDRQLKRPFTRFNLSPIHISELERCTNDLEYFKDNYIKIKTKTGINFPEIRSYQNDFLEVINSTHENIVGLLSRQSGKSISVGIYLAWNFNFKRDMNIGICANKGSAAREFLNNVKNMLLALPIWMQQGITVWNKGSISNENNMRILTDVPSANSFRGMTANILVVDECAFLPPNRYAEFTDSFFPAQAALAWKKNIIISTANGLNHFYTLVKGAQTPKKQSFEDCDVRMPDGTIKRLSELVKA